MGTPFQPLPCDAGGGAGSDAVDVEQFLLCDVLPDGSVAGTALAVYEYDPDGNPVGAPTFINPATNTPYAAQGVLQPCPGEVGCAPPVQFCFTSTASGPVEHPGRMYDISLPINPGFSVASLQIDATNYPANLLWAVTDADGSTFATALQAFLAARFPGETVTVNNPNAGSPVCGQAIPMTIHIECTRVDAPAPSLVELIFNGGRDLVVNPAYLTTPPTNLNGPQFVYMQRSDAGGTLNCTGVANRGWESNDGPPGGADFELWGQGPGGLQTQEAATPTPRGTPIQEITADFPAGGARPTIWQTFTVPAAGVLKAVLVHGARDNGEQHKITLSTGDDDANQTGDIINNVTNPPAVTNSGGGAPGPWTSFSQDVALGVGTYTFAISTTNPVGANRGGLFTDMRVYVDAPDQHATAVNDDDTCTITTEETTTTTTCEYWQPRCSNGEITAWVNVADGQELSNAAFWGQAPAPSCCLPAASSGGGGSVTAGNLVHTYEVCGVVGGISSTLHRVVITDQSGGVIAQTFVGPDGGPVSPTSWVPGACASAVEDALICYITADDTTPRQGFRRERLNAGASVVEFLGDNGAPVVPSFWRAGPCVADTEMVVRCDDGTNPPTPFIRRILWGAEEIATSSADTDFFGLPYTVTGDAVECEGCAPLVLDRVCVTSTDFPGTTLPAVAVKACDGTMTYLNPNTGVPWPNTTGVVICPPDNALWSEILCDAGNGGRQFRRVWNVTPLGSVVLYDEDLASAAYVVVGPVEICGSTVDPVVRDSESFVLCSSTPSPGTQFIRTRVYNDLGVIVATIDTTLAGAPFVPGAVSVCTQAVATDFDFVVQTLCDSNGTAFFRRLTFNSSTGAVTSTTDTTLAGGVFVPVGAVGLCSNCCPAVVGNGCISTGSGFYTAIRATNGTINLIDSVSGAAVLAANIIACPSDNTTRTLTAQGRALTNATPWTPGADVAGTLTSLTVTGTAGLWDVVDANGTALVGLPAGLTLTWTAEDDNTLTGPQSVTPQAGASVVANWTQR